MEESKVSFNKKGLTKKSQDIATWYNEVVVKAKLADYSEVKGKRINGLEEAMETDGVAIFSAGVDVEDGKFYANGGRLFSVVAEGNDILEAKQRAYSAMARISIEGNNLHYRTDIGWRDVERFLKERL